jgi:hypothetical protein
LVYRKQSERNVIYDHVILLDPLLAIGKFMYVKSAIPYGDKDAGNADY